MFGKNLKHLRERDHLSQVGLAKLLDRTDAAISQWETGTSVPRQSALEQLSRIFGVSIDDLLYKDLKNENHTPTERKAIRIKVLGSIPAGIPIEAIEVARSSRAWRTRNIEIARATDYTPLLFFYPKRDIAKISPMGCQYQLVRLQYKCVSTF